MPRMTPYEQNRGAWNSLAEQASPFAKVATDEECAQPLLQLDSRGWLPGNVTGLKVLCWPPAADGSRSCTQLRGRRSRWWTLVLRCCGSMPARLSGEDTSCE